MSPVVIALGVVIFILIYILYKYFNTTGTVLQGQTKLSSTIPPITSIASPTNTRYAYGIWIYINSWDATIQKPVFTRANNIAVYFDKLTPTLKCDITMQDNSVVTVPITTNFPLQKWSQIIISMDNQYLDGYIDGKLLVSQRVTSSKSATLMPIVPPDVTTGITLGGTSFDATVDKFKRWTNPVDPQTAWSSYMENSGSNSLTNSLSSYGVNLTILKDSVTQSQLTLL